jgi:hypothetical protein
MIIIKFKSDPWWKPDITFDELFGGILLSIFIVFIPLIISFLKESK